MDPKSAQLVGIVLLGVGILDPVIGLFVVGPRIPDPVKRRTVVMALVGSGALMMALGVVFLVAVGR